MGEVRGESQERILGSQLSPFFSMTHVVLAPEVHPVGAATGTRRCGLAGGQMFSGVQIGIPPKEEAYLAAGPH